MSYIVVKYYFISHFLCDTLCCTCAQLMIIKHFLLSYTCVRVCIFDSNHCDCMFVSCLHFQCYLWSLSYCIFLNFEILLKFFTNSPSAHLNRYIGHQYFTQRPSLWVYIPCVFKLAFN